MVPSMEQRKTDDTLKLMRPAVRLLITDLDNTIYDWVTYFAQSFYDMVDEAAKLLGKSLMKHLQELLKEEGPILAKKRVAKFRKIGSQYIISSPIES